MAIAPKWKSLKSAFATSGKIKAGCSIKKAILLRVVASAFDIKFTRPSKKPITIIEKTGIMLCVNISSKLI